MPSDIHELASLKYPSGPLGPDIMFKGTPGRNSSVPKIECDALWYFSNFSLKHFRIYSYSHLPLTKLRVPPRFSRKFQNFLESILLKLALPSFSVRQWEYNLCRYLQPVLIEYHCVLCTRVLEHSRARIHFHTVCLRHGCKLSVGGDNTFAIVANSSAEIRDFRKWCKLLDSQLLWSSF